MRTVLPSVDELSDNWATARTQVQRDIKRLKTTVNTSWDKEHTTDDGHGDMTALSINMRGAGIGEWVDLAYSSGRFVSDSSGWAVTAANTNYLKAMRIGELVTVLFKFEATVLSAISTQLYIAVPEFHAIAVKGTTGYQAWVGGNAIWVDTQHTTTGSAHVRATVIPSSTTYPSTFIQISRVTPTNATYSDWPTSTNLLVGGIIQFPVNPNNDPLAYSFV